LLIKRQLFKGCTIIGINKTIAPAPIVQIASTTFDMGADNPGGL